MKVEKVTVIRDDIVNGVREDSQECAVARAFRRAGLPADVDNSTIDVYDRETMRVTQLRVGNDLSDFIQMFDNSAEYIDDSDRFIAREYIDSIESFDIEWDDCDQRPIARMTNVKKRGAA